jgi:predicted nucleotidyltransferase component of viral defense system
MLTQPQVQRYSNESGLRDIMVAEKEVVLTFLLQLLSESGILDKLAFKGGTCLRKMFIGRDLEEVFDVSKFAPKQSKPRTQTSAEAVRAVAERSDFRSGEPAELGCVLGCVVRRTA